MRHTVRVIERIGKDTIRPTMHRESSPNLDQFFSWLIIIIIIINLFYLLNRRKLKIYILYSCYLYTLIKLSRSNKTLFIKFTYMYSLPLKHY